MAGDAEHGSDHGPGGALGPGLGDGGVDPFLRGVAVPDRGQDRLQGLAVEAGDRVGSLPVVGVLEFVEHLGFGSHQGHHVSQVLGSGRHGVEDPVRARVVADLQQLAVAARSDQEQVAVHGVDSDRVIDRVPDVVVADAVFTGVVHDLHT